MPQLANLQINVTKLQRQLFKTQSYALSVYIIST